MGQRGIIVNLFSLPSHQISVFVDILPITDILPCSWQYSNQVGCGSEQTGLVKGGPAHGRKVGTR